MTRTQHNLVPFSRTADYWIMRAGRRKNNAEHIQAGLLYRQAFEQSHKQDIALRIAENFVHMGCYTAAKRTALEIIRRDASSASAYYWLGITALAEKNEDLAEQLLLTALKKGRKLPLADTVQDLLNDYPWSDPPQFRRSQRAWSLYRLALDQLHEGSLKQAEFILRKAIRRGTCPEAEALLGELLLYRKQIRRSMPHLLRALRHLPTQVSIWLLLAQCAYQLGLQDCAGSSFTRALTLCQSSREWSMAATVSLLIHCPDTARKALQAAVRQSPESNDLLYVLAALEANSERLRDAIRHFNMILHSDPDDRDTKAALCIIGYGPVPMQRFEGDALLYQFAGADEPPCTGDTALRRLAHGMTISLGGAVAYHDVLELTSRIWALLNPLQRKLCDRQPDWANAIYRVFCTVFSLDGFPGHPLLWSSCARSRRIRRMNRYLFRLLSKDVDHDEPV